MMQAKEVSRLLAARAEEIAKYLLPAGKMDGNEWRVGNIGGEPGKSLGICLAGDKAGIWSDFSTGEAGDLLDLWKITKRNLTLSESIKEATRYLGLTQCEFEAYKSPNFVKPAAKKFSSLNVNSSVRNYLVDERKLSDQTLEKFKIEEDNRKIVFSYWRDSEVVFRKYLSLDRPNGKKQISVESNCEPCLFGWHVVPPNARSITICEGEIDAMSLYQYGYPALSVPFGGGGKNKQKWLEYEYDRLAIFDEIYLCFDNDSEGQAAVLELTERLGRHRCKIVKPPLKDANECLKAGISQVIIKDCFTNAKTLDPQELKSATEFVDQVINEFYPPQGSIIGYKTPWRKLDGKVLFRPEELSVFNGINGHGKSQFLGHILLHSMKQGARVCIASLELKPKRLLMRLTRQASAMNDPTQEYIRAIHNWYSDKLWLFDLLGTAKASRLLEVFRYARRRYNIDVFVIDSFMKLDIAEDDYKAQKAFIEALCDFKNEFSCHVHLIVHPRKGADESNAPGKLDTKGTGAISDLADNCFSIWRNKRKEELLRIQAAGSKLTNDQLEKTKEADCFLTCDKQRNGDWEGRSAFWFNPASFQYLSDEQAKSMPYVDYSAIK